MTCKVEGSKLFPTEKENLDPGHDPSLVLDLGPVPGPARSAVAAVGIVSLKANPDPDLDPNPEANLDLNLDLNPPVKSHRQEPENDLHHDPSPALVPEVPRPRTLLKRSKIREDQMMKKKKATVNK